MTVELDPLTEVHGSVMGRRTVFGAASKFSLHVPVQLGMEKGKQEGHRENQRCRYLGEAAGLAELEFGCLFLLAIFCLLIFLPCLLGPYPFLSQRVALSFLV